MKGQKLFTLDLDIIEELKKQDNASKLINDFLSDFFFSGRNQQKKKIEDNIKELEKEEKRKAEKLKLLKEKLREVVREEEEVKEIFKGLPAEILIDFQMFPKMTEEILMSRFKDIYSKAPNVSLKRVQEAYKKYFEGKRNGNKA